MKKFFTVIAAVALAVVTAMPATATESRLVALGGAASYVEDDFNIFDWPATLPSYSNVLWMTVNSATWNGSDWVYEWEPLALLGVSYGLGDDAQYGTLGLFFFHATSGLNPYGFGWPGANVFTGPIDNKFNLMYGYAMEGLSFGIYFSRADEGFTYEEDETSEDHEAYTTIGAGVRFDAGDNAYADVGFDFSMASYKEEDTGWGDISNDASTAIGVRGRLFYEWNETVTWVPYVNYQMYDFSLKADSAAYKDNFFGDKGMMIGFGVGANVTVNEDNLLIFAIEPFTYAKREPSEAPTDMNYEFKRLTMPRFFLALESDIKDWLTFRVGAVKELVKDESTTPGVAEDITVTDSYSRFNYFMGLGFHIGDFDIDCVLNNGLPYRLGYWLTGYQPYDEIDSQPLYMVTGKYHF